MELLVHPKTYFFILLLTPALLVRFCIFHRKLIVKSSWMRPIVTGFGVIQDAFLAWQGIFLVMLLKAFLPFAFPFLFWVLSLGYFLIQIDLIFDAFLYHKTSMRFDVSFFAFLSDLKSFWDSAKARGVWMFIGIGIGMLIINLTTISFLHSHMQAFALSSPFLWTGLALTVASIAGHALLPRRVAYSNSNTLLMQELWLLRKGFSTLFASIHFSKKFIMPNKALFFNDSEDFTLITPEYPILKYTRGFTGPKTCDVRIDQDEKPNVILLFMESWRSADVGILGGNYPITPNFDRLASEGICFKNFYSNSVKTSRAVTASQFGIPSDVETLDASSAPKFPLISIADVLKNNDYTCNYFLGSHLGFENQLQCLSSHGYDNLAGTEEILKAIPGSFGTSWGVHDEYLYQYLTQHLDQNRDTPQFCTLFTISNHHPWIDPPGPHRKLPLPAFDDPHYGHYLRTFHYSDMCLGNLVKALEEKGLSDNTILIVMGDHGQPMGEHDQSIVNQFGLFEENIHVPCLIHAPGRIQTPKMIDQLGSQLDLFPTIMDMLGLKGLNHTVGGSLLRRKQGKKVFFHNPYVHGYFGIRYDNYKLIYTRGTKETALYDLKLDPLEKNNIACQYPELVKELLGDVHCYEVFFKRLYRKRIYSPIVLDELELDYLKQSS